MKARSYPVVLSLALVLLAPISLRAADAADSTHTFLNPDDPALAEIRQLGERTIDHAGVSLVREVQRVLATQAPALAVSLLHLKDYKLPVAAPGQPVVIAIKRTSLRLRSPANSPDSPELAALERIERQLEDGDGVPKLLIQRVDLPGLPPEWRVYRPLGVMKSCLDCHGPKEELAPGVADALRVMFPADQAVDYKAGQWRGVLRVSILEPKKKS
jgi:Protein of unknown function (DUF3365)